MHEQLQDHPAHEYAFAAALLQQFETYWAYYSLSDGRQYAEQLFELAPDLVRQLGRVYDLRPAKAIKPPDKELHEFTVAELLHVIQEWQQSGTRWPMETLVSSSRLLHACLNRIKHSLLEACGVEDFPWVPYQSAQTLGHERMVRLIKPHLPAGLDYAGLPTPDAIIEVLTGSDSIVIFGDIRRSQDLMMYTRTPGEFFERMSAFVTTVRTLIDEYGGVFDKFTGDGFLAYLNAGIALRTDVPEKIDRSFVDFCIELTSFAAQHFREWGSVTSRVPEGGFGLGIGADIGRVVFDDSQNHLMAIGDAIVCANRLCGAAQPGTIIVSDALRATLLPDERCVFEHFQGVRKGNELFTGHLLDIHVPANYHEVLELKRKMKAEG